MESIRAVRINGETYLFEDALEYLEDHPFDHCSVNIEVDTNKSTYESEFVNSEEAISWLESILD